MVVPVSVLPVSATNWLWFTGTWARLGHLTLACKQSLVGCGPDKYYQSLLSFFDRVRDCDGKSQRQRVIFSIDF